MNKYGYCCINLSIKSKFRKTTVTWLKRNPRLVQDKLFEVYEHNLDELYRVITWNIRNNILLYRISSDLIPVADHQEFHQHWTEFKKIYNNSKLVDKIREYLNFGGRFTIHPSEYISLGSQRQIVVDNSISNLVYHGDLLDYLGLPNSYECPINIHLSNGKNIEAAASVAKHSLTRLPDNVMSRLVFENEDRGDWRWQNISRHFPEVPITLDFHHWNINNENEEIHEVVEKTCLTWKGFSPVYHHSEGRTATLDRSHSDFIENHPPVVDCWVEIEAKQKDLAVLKLIN